MKSIILNQTSIMETEFILSRGEIFFPHAWVQEEFHQISCLCDNPFDDSYVRNAKVRIGFLVDGKVVHEHNFTFKGGGSFHSALKDEVYKALGDSPRQSRRVRITTAPEAA